MEQVRGREGVTVTLPRMVSVGSVLAEAVVSNDDIPPFDNSAMDGYAVRVADLADESRTLDVVAEVRAGESAPDNIPMGGCFRIMTGAPIPPGCDAVVPVEHTSGWVDGGPVTIHRLPAAGQNIRRAGADVARGQTVLDVGAVVTPPVVGLLASLGKADVRVFRRPTVAIISTGDELVSDGEEIGAGRIRNSNGPGLAAQTTFAGGEVILETVARDDMDSVRSAIRRGLSADVVLIAGGVSAGVHDYVRAALAAEGVEILFEAVLQRPGKPLVFGRTERSIVFGLPGNPVSAAICFEQYTRPAIRVMHGHADTRDMREAELETDFSKRADLHYFTRGVARLVGSPGPGNALTVAPAGGQASNVYSSMVRSNCIIHLPEGRDEFHRGEKVVVEMYPW